MKLSHIDEFATSIAPITAELSMPWCVAGGWAIDLFIGRTTRSHADVELAIFRSDQAKLRNHLRGCTFTKIVDGQATTWNESETLCPAVHEVHATSSDVPPITIEFLLNERDKESWIFRRHASITLSMDRAVLTSVIGIPILAPEIVLLFKAKELRAKDQLDFESTVPVMSPSQLQWLGDNLAICHPEHPWLKLLTRTQL